MRRERGFGVNPWRTHSRFLISHNLLIDPTYADPMRDWLGQMLPGSLLILDEAHHAAPSSGGRYGIDTKFTRAVRDLAGRFEHRLFLSATPHNGHSNSFSALLEILDPYRFTRGEDPADSRGWISFEERLCSLGEVSGVQRSGIQDFSGARGRAPPAGPPPNTRISGNWPGTRRLWPRAQVALTAPIDDELLTESRCVCTGVAGLEPQAFVARTLKPYDPGPAVPLSVRLVVGKLPTKAPLTFNVYPVGAGPLAAESHTTKIVLPIV